MAWPWLPGSLLTAVRNWTQINTLKGFQLAGLATLWLAARLAGWIIPGQILPMAVLDLAFDLWLVIVIFLPLLRAKQHNQLGIASKIILLMLANLCFYLGVSGMLEQGIAWGLYSGLYVLLALIYSMARRVLPMFIERGVGYPVKLRNWAWIDRSGIYAFVLFLIADVFWRNVPVTAALAGFLFVIHAMRLAGWHTRGIWNKPLLWVLYLGYGGASFGFLLKALAPFLSVVTFSCFACICIGRHRHHHCRNDGAYLARTHRPQYSEILPSACACIYLIVHCLRCTCSIANNRAGTIPVVAGHRASRMDYCLCVARLGVCPYPCQATHRRAARLEASMLWSTLPS